MKRHDCLVVLAALLCSIVSFSSCEKVDPSGARHMRYSAKQDRSWNEGDKLAYFGGYTVQELGIEGTGGSNIAFFSGKVTPSTATNHVLFPYQKDASCIGNLIEATIPVEQTAVPGSFDPQAALMVASCATEESLVFHNVTSFISFTTDRVLAKVTLKGNKGEMVAGKVSIDVDKAKVSGGSSEVVVLKAAEGTVMEPGLYAISVNPVVFKEGFELTFTTPKAENASVIWYGDSNNDYIHIAEGLQDCSAINVIHPYGIVDKFAYSAIDMGYGLKWSSVNVGAASVGENGDMVAKAGIDAAIKAFGDQWRMPTVEEWKEMVEKCYWRFCDGYVFQHEAGLNKQGFKLYGEDGNSILLQFDGDSVDYWAAGGGSTLHLTKKDKSVISAAATEAAIRPVMSAK